MLSVMGKKEKMTYGKVGQMFDKGTIWNAPKEDLEACMEGLATEGTDNDRIKHAAVIRALAIINIQQRKQIEEIEKRSHMSERWFKVLALGSLFLGFIALGWQIGVDTHIIALPDQPNTTPSTPDAQVEAVAVEELSSPPTPIHQPTEP